MNEELKQETNSKRRIRSVAYPSVDFEEAVRSTEDLRKKLGMGPYSRLAAVKALGYSGISGASATKIAALVHFGLLSRSADTYRQSPLADRILIPKDDTDKNKAIIEAVRTPKLYEQLIKDFSNKSLPTLLPNVLFHQYKINEKVSKEVAVTFTKSIEFAGILKNGIIICPEGDVVSSNQESEQTGTIANNGDKPAGKFVLGEISILLGPDITVNFSQKLSRDVADGKFKEALNLLEKLGERVKDGTSTNNASDTQVESN